MVNIIFDCIALRPEIFGANRKGWIHHVRQRGMRWEEKKQYTMQCTLYETPKYIGLYSRNTKTGPSTISKVSYTRRLK